MAVALIVFVISAVSKAAGVERPIAPNRGPAIYAAFHTMSEASSDEERELRVKLMTADIANKQADTNYKEGLARYEPWKVAFTAFASGAALVGAMVALESYLHREPPSAASSAAPAPAPPALTVLQLPPGTMITVPGLPAVSVPPVPAPVPGSTAPAPAPSGK